MCRLYEHKVRLCPAPYELLFQLHSVLSRNDPTVIARVLMLAQNHNHKFFMGFYMTGRVYNVRPSIIFIINIIECRHVNTFYEYRRLLALFRLLEMYHTENSPNNQELFTVPPIKEEELALAILLSMSEMSFKTITG